MSATEIRSLNGYKLTDETARSNIEKLRTESQQYTNTKISQLINSAPTTLDTLGEIAAAMAENATVVEALDAAIGQKAGKDYVDETVEKAMVFVTDMEILSMMLEEGALPIIQTEDGAVLTVASNEILMI